MHGVHSVSRRSCEKLLQRGPGHAITIVVGGAQESLLSRPHTLHLVIKKRMGFIKLAIRNGSYLVPVLSFGEADVSNLMRLMLTLAIRTSRKPAFFQLVQISAIGKTKYGLHCPACACPRNL
jgi:hypothetical protein